MANTRSGHVDSHLAALRRLWKKSKNAGKFRIFEGVILPDETTEEDRWRIEVRGIGEQKIEALLDVSLVEAAGHVVPVARTAAESIERLRTWAHGRCLSADEPGLFRRDQLACSRKTDPCGMRVSRAQ